MSFTPPTRRRYLPRSWSGIAIGLVAPLLAACASHHEPTTPLRAGDIVTWAGDGTQGHDGDGHSRLESWLNQPTALSFAADDTALIVDWNNHCVRSVTAAGTLQNLIGQELPGDWPCQNPDDSANCALPLSGEIAGSELNLNHPLTTAWDGTDGSFYLAAWHNHKLEHYDAGSGEVTVIAGGQKPGFVGDGGPATAALLNFPSSIAVRADGALLFSDQRNNRVRRIEGGADGALATVAGASAMMGTDGDGMPATETLLQLTTADEVAGADNPPPGGAIALERDGGLLIADTFHHCIRRVDPGQDGVVGDGDLSEERVSTVAGRCGSEGYAGDGGPATKALLDRPFGLAFDPQGDLYIADTYNNVVRRIDASTGKIETVAGTGEPGFSGDGGPATAARLREPYNIAFDRYGDLYVVDTHNNRIRKVAH